MFPKATLRKIMKTYADGEIYDFRISQEAVDAIDKILANYIKDIMQRARRHAQAHGRKTIKKEDILAALPIKFKQASELLEEVKAHE